MLFLYIAGPMAGQPQHGVPLFDAVAKSLRANGHVPVNPADNARELAMKAGVSLTEYRERYSDRDWRIHIYKHDLRKLVTCDGIVLLPGWHKSRGATLESLVAYQLGIRFWLWNGDSVLTEITDNLRPLTHFIELHHKAEAKHFGAPAPQKPKTETVCAEADRLVDGARQKDYGHPLDNYDRVATLWTALLRGQKLNFNTDNFEPTESADNNSSAEPRSDWLNAEMVVAMMILLKMGRLKNGFHRDSVVDIAGYAKCLDMIHTERERRAK